MLDEVLSKPYRDPEDVGTFGPDGGESGRTQYDNIDDYHGFSESAGELCDQAGERYPDVYQAFGRSVMIESKMVNVSPLGSQTGLMIEVTVRDAHGKTWTVRRFVPEPTS